MKLKKNIHIDRVCVVAEANIRGSFLTAFGMKTSEKQLWDFFVWTLKFVPI